MNDKSDAVLTRAQAAEALQICTATLDKLPIPRIKVGRRVLYRRATVEAWLAKLEGMEYGRRA